MARSGVVVVCFLCASLGCSSTQKAQQLQQSTQAQASAAKEAETAKKKESAISLNRVKVVQVLDTGLLVETSEENIIGKYHVVTYYLEGYPKGKDATNGSLISCKAYHDGSYEYRTSVGATVKVHRYVYCGE